MGGQSTTSRQSSSSPPSPTTKWGRFWHWWKQLPLNEKVPVWLTLITIVLALVTTVLAIAAIGLAWLQVVDHDRDDLQSHQTQCTSALISLSAELSRRSYLVDQIGKATNDADKQRAQDSDIALTGAWNSEKVACETSNLLNARTEVGQHRVEAYAVSLRPIATPDSSADSAAVTAAINWASFAVLEVEKVRLKDPWLFDNSWQYPTDKYSFGQS